MDHFNQAFWDERYRSHGEVWSGEPNPQLVSEVSDLAPGTALDIGSGEGADAIWLAQRGWQVSAVDISTVALERAAARALEAGPEVAQRIDWIHADLTQWVPDASYDLVSSQFLHLPPPDRGLVFGRLASAVSTGGTLLIVGHHPSDLNTTVRRPPLPELFFTASEVAAALDSADWDIVVDEARARTATDPAGSTVTIHDAVLRALRH